MLSWFYPYSTYEKAGQLEYQAVSVSGEEKLIYSAIFLSNRAVYHGAEVFLVDDIFSAVDDKEAVHILTK